MANQKSPPKYNQKIRDLADRYVKSKGLTINHDQKSVLNEARSKEIAQAYDAMKHDPKDPKVKAAYKALINETTDQYKAIRKAGLKVTPIASDQANPYKSSTDMLKDVAENNHLYYYPTDQGFGSKEDKTSDHPLLAHTGETIKGKPLLANDAFRIVHDYFGHAKEGNSFGPKGEEAAWHHHMQMYTPEARKALTTETRGQNSWVNFGPKGTENRANPENTQYAEQKAGILPDFALTPNKDTPEQFADGGGVGQATEPTIKALTGTPALQPGDIPVDQFEAAPQPQPGDIPVEHFQAAEPQQLQPGDIPIDQFQTQEQAYGGAGQTLKAAAEGIAKGVSGPIAPYLERMAGITAKTQRERAAAHPIASGVGEATGLAGSMLTGVGEGALMTHAGELAAKATGLAEGASYAARIGSSAVRQAAEMAILQGSDEVAKRVLNDPNTSAETSLANIGLASALGGATGAFVTGVVSPLWKATVGDRLSTGLKALTSGLGGIEGVASNTANDLEAKAGVTIPNELKAVIDDAPGMKNSHSILSQSDTIAGRNYQKKIATLNDELTNTIAGSLGHTPESIENLGDLDKYSKGRDIGETLHSEIKPITEEISNRYDKVSDKFKTALVSPAEKQGINEAISKLSLEKGWNKAESDTISNFADNVMEKIPKQETVEDLKKFMTNIRDAHPYGSPTYQAAKDISNIIKSSQEKIISSNLGPEELASYNALKSDYSKLMDTFDSLNEHLHVGRYDGPKGFLTALKEKSSANGEQVLDRLLGGKRADVLEQLRQFPETLNKVKQYHIDSLINQASTPGVEGANININKLLKKLDNLSPQVKDLIASPRQHQAIDAVASITEGLKDPTHNWSNTARTAAKLSHGVPSVFSLLAALTGHAEAGVLSFLGKLGLTEGKDALKLGMMKFLSSAQPLDSDGFKAMVSYIDSAYKGEAKTAKAVQGVLKPGFAVLASSQMPSSHEIERLSRLVAQSLDNPGDPSNSKVGSYLPGHDQALAKATGQALNHLQQLQPKPIRLGPLDKAMKPSIMEQARYDKALEIAINPLVVLKKCKDGTLQTTDIQDLQAMYPAAYTNMQQKLMSEIINKQTDNEAIPYKTRLCISQFMQQPLDASMAPNSIQAAQMTYAPKQPPQQQGAMSKPKKGTATLNKASNAYKTTTQAAESDRSNRD